MTDDSTVPNEARASTPAFKFRDTSRRAKTIPLAWPIEGDDGKVYNAVVIRRLTAKQVADLIEAAKDQPEGEIRLPLFADTDGNVLPPEFLDTLDDDDSAVLNEAALDFFPRRFLPRPRTEAEPAPAPAFGGSTARSSAA